MVNVKITQNRKKCVGCGTCAVLCPVHIWQMDKDKKAYPEKPWDRCTHCLRCQTNCPVQCITVKLLDKKHKHKADPEGLHVHKKLSHQFAKRYHK